jgi:sugar phosphate isomerase/epimerase
MKKNFSVLVLIVVFLSPKNDALAQSGKPLYTAAFGLQTYSFRNSFQYGVASVLDTVKMMGFTEVEGGGGSIPLLKEFKKLCDERGLSIPSTGTSFEQLEKSPDSVAIRAKILGSKYVMCSWIPHKNRGNFNLDDAKKAVEVFNTSGKVLKDKGITLCYHIHGYEFQPHNNGTLLDYIIENTNPEYVSFEMDIMWVYFGGGDPAGLLKKYGSRWKLMHLKDLKKGTPKDMTGSTDEDNDVALGTGELDIPGILKAAKAAGVKHYFIEDESHAVMTQVPKSVQYLKSLKE